MPKFPKYGILCPFLYVKFSEPIKHTNHNSLINCLLMQQSTHTHHTHIFSTFPLQTTTATIHHQINVIHHYDSSNTKTQERPKCDSTAIVHPLFSLQANLHRTHSGPTPHIQTKKNTLPQPTKYTLNTATHSIRFTQTPGSNHLHCPSLHFSLCNNHLLNTFLPPRLGRAQEEMRKSLTDSEGGMAPKGYPFLGKTCQHWWPSRPE